MKIVRITKKNKVMKANVPEKIYINSNLENRTRLIGKGDISFIEYTRTDAFIEKAVSWLKEHREAVETEDNGIMGWIPDYFIEDFRKYMEE